MVNKEELEKSYKKFLDNPCDENIWELVQKCQPLFVYCLSKYKDKFSKDEIGDLKSGARIVMFQSFSRMRKNKMRYLKDQIPYIYWFLVVKCMNTIKNEINKHLRHERKKVPLSNSEVLTYVSNDSIDPEILYIIQKEIPREFFEICKKEIENDPSLKKFPALKKEKIQKIKKKIKSFYGENWDERN
jgi:hypothetical protein